MGLTELIRERKKKKERKKVMQRNGGGEEEKENGSSRQSIPLFKKVKNRYLFLLVKTCDFSFF